MGFADSIAKARQNRRQAQPQEALGGMSSDDLFTAYGNSGERFKKGALDQSGIADERRRNAADSRNRFLDILGGGEDALRRMTESAMAAGMPQLQRTLQGSRESAQRRGIGTGDLGTSYEGDIMSAFQQNIANSVAQQALGLFGTQLGAAGNLYGQEAGQEIEARNTYLDIIGNMVEGDRAKKAGKQQMIGSALGGLFGMGGMALGGYFGGMGGGK